MVQRTTTLVFEIPPAQRTNVEKLAVVARLFQEAVSQREAALKEEARAIVSALRRTLDGKGRGNLRSARWYRTCSQLEMLEPLAAEAIELLSNAEVPPDARLEAVLELLERTLRETMTALCDEAGTISNDMEALTMRLASEGHQAELRDIQSAHWYTIVGQLEMLKQLYRAVHEVDGRTVGVVMMPAEDQDGAPDETEQED